MREIGSLNDSPKQKFRYSLDGYEPVEFTIEFREQQYSWFMNMVWGDFSMYNERIAIAPNLLRQFRNTLPFGIMIIGPDNVDPFSVTAWMDGWKFIMLDETDVADIEEYYVK